MINQSVTSAIFPNKIGSRIHRVTHNLVGGGGGGGLVISMPGKKKVLECHSGLHPSEKELPELHSGAFCHRTIPECNIN
jgi:hypothetical protein